MPTPCCPSDGAVWIGTRRGVAVLRDDRLETPEVLAPMRSAQINGIVRDRAGALWFATTQGLFRLRRDGLRPAGRGAGLPRPAHARAAGNPRRPHAGRHPVGPVRSGRRPRPPLGLATGLRTDLDITAIHELDDGKLVIGALSEEIFLFDGQRWTTFGRGSGIPVNSAFFITHDRSGFLWVAGLRGIHRVPVDDLLAVAEGRATQVRGEMLLNERGDRRGGQKGYCCNGAGNAKGFQFGGELWLPTRDGVVAMSTTGIVKNPVAPRSLIERMRVGDQWRDADPSADWRLPPDSRDLSFEFTVLSFQDPNSVELRYRLVGYDDDWRTLDDPSRRIVNYTNLPPGRLRVRGAGRQQRRRLEHRAGAAGLLASSRCSMKRRCSTCCWRRCWAASCMPATGCSCRRTGASSAALEQLVGQRTEALEVANLRLEEASQTDPLTGLRNRRYLATQIPADIAFYDREAVRRGTPGEVMVFALVDIDHFSAVDDRHGHGCRRPRAAAVRAGAGPAGAHRRLRGALGRRRVPDRVPAHAEPQHPHPGRAHPRRHRPPSLRHGHRRAAVADLLGGPGGMPAVPRRARQPGLGTGGGPGRPRAVLREAPRPQRLGRVPPAQRQRPAGPGAGLGRRPRQAGGPGPGAAAGVGHPHAAARARRAPSPDAAVRLCSRRCKPLRADCPIFLLLVALYAAGGAYSSLLLDGPGEVALFWPSSGIALAGVVRFGLRWALFVPLGGLLVHLLFDPVSMVFLPYSLASNYLARAGGRLAGAAPPGGRPADRALRAAGPAGRHGDGAGQRLHRHASACSRPATLRCRRCPRRRCAGSWATCWAWPRWRRR